MVPSLELKSKETEQVKQDRVDKKSMRSILGTTGNNKNNTTVVKLQMGERVRRGSIKL